MHPPFIILISSHDVFNIFILILVYYSGEDFGTCWLLEKHVQRWKAWKASGHDPTILEGDCQVSSSYAEARWDIYPYLSINIHTLIPYQILHNFFFVEMIVWSTPTLCYRMGYIPIIVINFVACNIDIGLLYHPCHGNTPNILLLTWFKRDPNIIDTIPFFNFFYWI